MEPRDPYEPVRILIGSAGRRVYLIRWFRQALQQLGLRGKIYVTENDPTSSSYAAADGAFAIPSYDDPDYVQAMEQTIRDFKPHLFFSVNDYELSALSRGLADRLRKSGAIVVSLSRESQRVVEDKWEMARAFHDHGIDTPTTVLSGDTAGIRRLADQSSELVVKHRFGSGSSGLHFASPNDVHEAIRHSTRTAPKGERRLREADLVVVQPRLLGSEYGVDIVGPLISNGEPRVAGVLARRKMRMRSGETDKAISVPAGPFRETAQKVSEVLNLTGIVDTDMISTPGGAPKIIDVNPRFGGGYVFSHLAGANVPVFYLEQLLGLQTDPKWADYETDVISAKFEDAIVTSGRQ